MDIRTVRDLGIRAVASGLLIYEVVWGGGRAAVLTALTGLLLSPTVMHIDEVRRDNQRQGRHVDE